MCLKSPKMPAMAPPPAPPPAAPMNFSIPSPPPAPSFTPPPTPEPPPKMQEAKTPERVDRDKSIKPGTAQRGRVRPRAANTMLSPLVEQASSLLGSLGGNR